MRGRNHRSPNGSSPGSGSTVLVVRLLFPGRFLTIVVLAFFTRLPVLGGVRFWTFETDFTIRRTPLWRAYELEFSTFQLIHRGSSKFFSRVTSLRSKGVSYEYVVARQACQADSRACGHPCHAHG
jgi:hypothetical protein